MLCNVLGEGEFERSWHWACSDVLSWLRIWWGCSAEYFSCTSFTYFSLRAYTMMATKMMATDHDNDGHRVHSDGHIVVVVIFCGHRCCGCHYHGLWPSLPMVWPSLFVAVVIEPPPLCTCSFFAIDWCLCE